MAGAAADGGRMLLEPPRAWPVPPEQPRSRRVGATAGGICCQGFYGWICPRCSYCSWVLSPGPLCANLPRAELLRLGAHLM